MATPIDPAGTASQVTNIAPAERRPETEASESRRVEETQATETSSSPRNQTPDPDSNTGRNIDTTA